MGLSRSAAECAAGECTKFVEFTANWDGLGRFQFFRQIFDRGRAGTPVLDGESSSGRSDLGIEHSIVGVRDAMRTSSAIVPPAMSRASCDTRGLWLSALSCVIDTRDASRTKRRPICARHRWQQRHRPRYCAGSQAPLRCDRNRRAQCGAPCTGGQGLAR